MRLRARSRLEQAGFTLAEAVVTVAVSMMGLGGVMMMNAQQLKLVSSTRESNAASWVLQDRLETLRDISWDHLTKADRLKVKLSEVPDCAQLLPGYTERITLVKSTEADDTSAEKLIVERGPDGAMRTVSSASGISTSREVKVDVLVSWTSRGGRTRERSYTSIISDSGVTRNNIPGFGGPTGATPVENGSPSDGWTADEGAPSTTQPTEIVPTTGNGNSSSGNNGNGNSSNGSGEDSSSGNGNGNSNPHGNTNKKNGKG
jgi:Tfp pilus assembly protein PilV